MHSSLPFSAPAASSFPELSFSACDTIAVSKSCQLRCWQESAACYGKDVVKAEIISQRSRTTSLQTLCSINNIKLPSQIASGGFWEGLCVDEKSNAICMSLRHLNNSLCSLSFEGVLAYIIIVWKRNQTGFFYHLEVVLLPGGISSLCHN